MLLHGDLPSFLGAWLWPPGNTENRQNSDQYYSQNSDQYVLYVIQTVPALPPSNTENSQNSDQYVLYVIQTVPALPPSNTENSQNSGQYVLYVIQTVPGYVLPVTLKTVKTVISITVNKVVSTTVKTVVSMCYTSYRQCLPMASQ